MVDNGHISETHLREILDQEDDQTDTEDDEAYVEAKLEVRPIHANRIALLCPGPAPANLSPNSTTVTEICSPVASSTLASYPPRCSLTCFCG